jgi:Rieske Fe-S protein
MEPGMKDDAAPDLVRRSFLIRLNLILGFALSVPLIYPLIRYVGSGMYPGLDNTWISLGRGDQFVEYDRPQLVKFLRVREDAYTIRSVEKSHWVLRASTELLREIYAGGHVEFRDETGKVFWENSPGGEFVVFSGKCPHLGCAYRWREAKGVFFCPCHVSIFRLDGQVVSGPAPRGLDQLPVRIKEGRLEIIDAEFKAGKRVQVRLV